MEAAAQEILTDKTINPVFQRAYNVRGWVNTRAYEIKHEMALGERKPFDEVVIHYGDPHAFGQSPITFVRQCLACLLCPQFLNDPQFPKDVKEKARRILKATPGFAISSYTNIIGLRLIREDVAKYISRRDGYPADVDDVILTNGGAIGIQIGLASLGTDMPNGKLKPGLMIPIPVFPQYKSRIVEFNLYEIPYYLEEENNWSFNIGEMKKAIDKARPHCEPRGLVLINPGNPTGQILSYDNISEVIKFCAREKLVLFADEVYQETVFTKGVPFHSCRKVLRDLGPEYNNFQLMSLNSASKGFYGECGLRGGYLELVGFSNAVKSQFRDMMSPSISGSTIGQAAMSLICCPPQPGDESYEIFIQEKTAILESYERKAKITTAMLNSLEGVTCNEVTGALYAFPRIRLPQKAIEEAKRNNLNPDGFYCWQLMETTGIVPIPGENYGQKEGTYHFRLTILPSEEKIAPMYERLSKFHKEFMDKYKDNKEN
ncbi:alanine aminotransferase 2-like isoform X1 [Pocillopora verrucosa]|uniref:alanine aminotransferase 2-like isoform X1 n=1 Tax=Pocillopora verrucosa TaxID=203993 RepID=UPI003341E0E3